MNFIIVTKKELDHYLYKTTKNNEIIRFWRDIFKKTPGKIRLELRTTPTNLIPNDNGEFKIIGYRSYVFVSKNSSENLSNFLKAYTVYVFQDNEEEYNSEVDIELSLKIRTPKGRV
jgi:hypothetical protein